MNPVENYRFTRSHEWVRLNGDQTVTVGISDFAQSALGDIVFIELPEMAAQLQAAAAVAVVESVKAASDIYSPLSGVVVEVNSRLLDAPELLNESPYEEGWLYRLAADNPEELDALLSHAEYHALNP